MDAFGATGGLHQYLEQGCVVAKALTFQPSNQHNANVQIWAAVSFLQYVGSYLCEKVGFPEEACKAAACLKLSSWGSSAFVSGYLLDISLCSN